MSNPLSNLLLLVSEDLQLSQSCPCEGIILPQAQRAVDISFRIFAGVVRIFFVIFGLVGEMP
jgi:hypothetical protein